MDVYKWAHKELDFNDANRVDTSYRLLTEALTRLRMNYRVQIGEKIEMEIEVGDRIDRFKMNFLEIIVHQVEMGLPQGVNLDLEEDAVLPPKSGDYFRRVTFSLGSKEDSEGWIDIHD